MKTKMSKDEAVIAVNLVRDSVAFYIDGDITERYSIYRQLGNIAESIEALDVPMPEPEFIEGDVDLFEDARDGKAINGAGHWKSVTKVTPPLGVKIEVKTSTGLIRKGVIPEGKMNAKKTAYYGYGEVGSFSAVEWREIND